LGGAAVSVKATVEIEKWFGEQITKRSSELASDSSGNDNTEQLWQANHTASEWASERLKWKR
jgi:hypothetical protein